MIVCITGGTGFIGQRLVYKHLQRGDEVRVVSRQKPKDDLSKLSLKWCQADLTMDADILERFVDGADVLYHCAAEIRDPSRMHVTNVEATKHLVGFASGRVGRWVQLSSVGAYGRIRNGIVTEDTELRPLGIYETTKAEADVLVTEAAHEGAFELAILRPSNVYGMYMPNQSLFKLISVVDRGFFFFIGRPGASANYIHVENVVNALILCGCHPAAAQNVFNLSDYQPLEIFIKYIAEALGKPIPSLRFPESPLRVLAKTSKPLIGTGRIEATIDALTNRAQYPASKIERELGYKHSVSMQSGITELVKSWKHLKKNNG